MLYKGLLAVICISAALVSGCATSYHESWHEDGGYAEERLHPDYPIYGVRSSCNGFTSSEQCGDIALRRSAEICADRSYDGFTVLDRSNAVSRSEGQYTYSTTETARTRVSSTYSDNYGYRGYGNAYATTTYQQPHTVNYTVSKPRTEMWIGCLRRAEYRDFAVVYDNGDVLERTEYLVR